MIVLCRVGEIMMDFFRVAIQRNRVITCFWVLLLVLVHNGKQTISASNYLVGLGSYDITGPAADVNMMGYANSDQTASGIHFRLRSRAFIVAEPQGNRAVFVNLDACMGSQLVTIKVLERLKARYFSHLVIILLLNYTITDKIIIYYRFFIVLQNTLNSRSTWSVLFQLII